MDFKLKTLSMISALLLVLSMAGIANAGIIDIDALTNSNSNPVSLSLDAGTYDVTPVGTADGGLYNAWNPWGFTSGCVNGENCTNGYVNTYSFSSGEFGTVTTGNGVKYGTDILALANALESSFTLSTAATVNFYIPDSYYLDNTGGMSLDVSQSYSAVPEPSIILLLGIGLAGLLSLKKKF